MHRTYYNSTYWVNMLSRLHLYLLTTVLTYCNYTYQVNMLSRHLAVSLAPNVTVNSIAPGPFRSRMMRGTLMGTNPVPTPNPTPKQEHHVSLKANPTPNPNSFP